ncbi:MAG: hypothetical protein KH632_09655 [Sutterella wadsworthensis]|uniref:hypothetical protein n=1 Tax=Sutterella wadsworthensis TaxID=40545 RepID=UPI003966D8A8|nr:hypothetical protein [Sutterella wadsworthensis]
MKYLISYDLHGVSPDLSNDVRNRLEECGLKQILGSTLLYETMGVESAKSVYDGIYGIIYTRLQKGISQIVLGAGKIQLDSKTHSFVGWLLFHPNFYWLRSHKLPC